MVDEILASTDDEPIMEVRSELKLDLDRPEYGPRPPAQGFAVARRVSEAGRALGAA